MKKIYTTVFAFLVFGSSILVSCSSDDSAADPVAENPTPGISSGDYYPTAINNQWVYDFGNPSTIKIISSSVIDGNTYYTFAPSQAGPSANQSVRKTNGDYYIKTEDISIPMNGPVPASTTTGIEILLMKDYLSEGQSWSQNYTQTTSYGSFGSITLNVSNVSTIEEVGSTVLIAGVTYTDVIRMKQVATYTGTMTPLTVSTNTYWFAKDIGVIKIQVASDDVEGYTQEIVSYQLF